MSRDLEAYVMSLARNQFSCSRFFRESILHDSWDAVHSGQFERVCGTLVRSFYETSLLISSTSQLPLQTFLEERAVYISGQISENILHNFNEKSGNLSCPHNQSWKGPPDQPLYSGLPGSKRLIEVPDSVSLLEFCSLYHSNQPAIVRGFCRRWPVVKAGNCPCFWVCTLGKRYLPVEIGGYLSRNFMQAFVKMEDYISFINIPRVDPHVYLAQVDLRFLPEIESLASPLPDHGLILGNSVNRQLFLGPSGTISAMHTDPQANLLCQLFGFKYVRLHDPRDDNFVYANRSGRSTFLPPDVLSSSDHISTEFPLYARARTYEGVLGPGDCLVIPKGWWHFIKSLSPSGSIAHFFED
jgi:hypothetical protein